MTSENEIIYKLNCLEQAVKTCGTDDDRTLSVAKKYFDWIVGNTPAAEAKGITHEVFAKQFLSP